MAPINSLWRPLETCGKGRKKKKKRKISAQRTICGRRNYSKCASSKRLKTVCSRPIAERGELRSLEAFKENDR